MPLLRSSPCRHSQLPPMAGLRAHCAAMGSAVLSAGFRPGCRWGLPRSGPRPRGDGQPATGASARRTTRAQPPARPAGTQAAAGGAPGGWRPVPAGPVTGPGRAVAEGRRAARKPSPWRRTPCSPARSTTLPASSRYCSTAAPTLAASNAARASSSGHGQRARRPAGDDQPGLPVARRPGDEAGTDPAQGKQGR